MYDDIEVVTTATSVLTNKTLGVGFIDRTLELHLLVPKLTSHVDVGSLGTHAESDDECTFHKLVGVMSQDLTILASSWLRLVRINYEVGWSIQKEISS